MIAAMILQGPLSDPHRALLEELAHQTVHGVDPSVAGITLRRKVKGSHEERQEILLGLIPLFAKAEGGTYPNSDRYRLKLRGLLTTREGARAAQCIAGTLEFLRQKLEREGDFVRFTWKELGAFGRTRLALSDNDLEWFTQVADVAGLASNCSSAEGDHIRLWGKPRNLERLLDCRDAIELLEFQAHGEGRQLDAELLRVLDDVVKTFFGGPGRTKLGKALRAHLSGDLNLRRARLLELVGFELRSGAYFPEDWYAPTLSGVLASTQGTTTRTYLRWFCLVVQERFRRDPACQTFRWSDVTNTAWKVDAQEVSDEEARDFDSVMALTRLSHAATPDRGERTWTMPSNAEEISHWKTPNTVIDWLLAKDRSSPPDEYVHDITALPTSADSGDSTSISEEGTADVPRERTRTAEPPHAFLSYSYDDELHKAWVLTLAKRLRECGVETTLDQWDLHPGKDLAEFMESGIRRSTHVIVVCSSLYADRANSRKGGVGYEGMLLTQELIANLGTDRFIPIIRNNEQRTLPSYLGTRIFIDFRDDKHFESKLEDLVRQLHGTPRLAKPPLGTNPFR